MKSSASTANGQEVPSSVVTKLTVLGATGSIGLNTLEIVRQFP
ncbi:MAG TPA: 1-deoxy-D-xylulose-5-phosphate reductoisomerase, partial [Deltaproteobacteria bacterium]|nr:1-deoxy-D-xylulose-5-phosphate reductoisomerase [Candidatus Lambdaproteobacteria bacterium]HIB38641.1 1-deoxy-D-xylulose-5-phosphate reductoisomerase [Candidatus Lambdaproteobacteria bacterium]HIC07897.1 1-deoxy-D-xylulose-5-phosphate reductoisomerase [Candidatus Lambdaproteobacteria bacterium]HIM99648.1 1-deoxy-D-xylulose-5-phosphate reductoisomerase [Deltaproteobacteria bacterium]